MGVVQWLKGLFVGAGCLAFGAGILSHQLQELSAPVGESFHAGSASAEPAEAERSGRGLDAEPADWNEPARDDEVWQARQSIDGHFGKVQDLTLSERVAYWSAYLAKSGPDDLIRWTRDPASNAPRIEDSAPLFPEKFDCTTYVESVAALARSSSPGDLFDELLAIRYRDSRGDFLARNHFPEMDWIPNNERSGILRDITRDVAYQAGIEPGLARKTIDKSAWLAAQVSRGQVSRSIASVAAKNDDEAAWRSSATVELSYIPLAHIDRVMNHLPHGAVLNLVRRDSLKHPVLISHQGFVVREGDRVLLRHSSAKGRMSTIDLKRYLEQSKKFRSWPVLGINLNRLSENRAHSIH